MKIILATSLFPPEIAAPGRYVKELAGRLSANHQVKIICYANRTEKVRGVDIVTLKKDRSLLQKMLTFTYASFKATRRADLIFSQNYVSCAWPAVIAGRLSRRPAIVRYMADEAYERARRKYTNIGPIENFLATPPANLRIRTILLLERLVFRSAALVIAPSRHSADILSAYYRVKPERIHIIPDPAPSLIKLPLPPAVRTRSVCLAPHSNQAAVNAFLTAIARLQKDFPDIKAVFLGSDDKNEVRTEAKRLGIRDRVTVFRRLTPLEEYYRLTGATVYLDLSDRPDRDLILRAWQAGARVLTKTNKYDDNIVSDGRNGLTVDSANEIDVALALSKLLSNPDLGRYLADNAAADLDKYSWSGHARRLEESFKLKQHERK